MDRNGARTQIGIAGIPTDNCPESLRSYGGIDYLEKTLDGERLLKALRQGVGWSLERREKIDKVMRLSHREREAFEYIARGHSSKAIAQGEWALAQGRSRTIAPISLPTREVLR